MTRWNKGSEVVERLLDAPHLERFRNIQTPDERDLGHADLI